jgi:hypothetical protein
MNDLFLIDYSLFFSHEAGVKTSLKNEVTGCIVWFGPVSCWVTHSGANGTSAALTFFLIFSLCTPLICCI